MEASAVAGNGQEFQEEVAFASFPPLGEVLVTTDGHLFGVVQDNDQIQFVWDGATGEPFNQLVPARDDTTVFWSDDGRHIAYIGLRADRSFVGRDGGEDPSYEAPTRSVPPVFSPHGTHLAYGARVDGVYRLIVDGQPIGEMALAPIAAGFSPDGNRLAYVELREAPGEKPEFRIVLDGKPGEWFRGMRNAGGVLQFSPDSRRFAYYRINENLEGQWVVDGTEQRWVNDVRPLTFARVRGIGAVEPPMVAAFSPDSRRFAYWADVKEKGVAVIEDDVAGPLVHGAGRPVFSSDSRRLAYGAQTFAKKIVVVVDGVAGAEWASPDSGDPVFSPDGRHVAIMLQREEGGFLRKHRVYSVVLDDQVLADEPGDDSSAEVVFSPDGTHLAWWLRQGADWFVYVDDRPSSKLDGVSDLRYSSSGHVVHPARLGKSSTIMVDGQPGPLAEDLATCGPLPSDGPYRLSADGEHVAWIGQFADGVRPILDARTGPAFEGIYYCSFLEDGSAQWWGRRGDTISRVTANP
jgi:WD40-like Beta Propeller Repeat